MTFEILEKTFTQKRISWDILKTKAHFLFKYEKVEGTIEETDKGVSVSFVVTDATDGNKDKTVEYESLSKDVCKAFQSAVSAYQSYILKRRKKSDKLVKLVKSILKQELQ